MNTIENQSIRTEVTKSRQQFDLLKSKTMKTNGKTNKSKFQNLHLGNLIESN